MQNAHGNIMADRSSSIHCQCWTNAWRKICSIICKGVIYAYWPGIILFMVYLTFWQVFSHLCWNIEFQYRTISEYLLLFNHTSSYALLWHAMYMVFRLWQCSNSIVGFPLDHLGLVTTPICSMYHSGFLNDRGSTKVVQYKRRNRLTAIHFTIPTQLVGLYCPCCFKAVQNAYTVACI